MARTPRTFGEAVEARVERSRIDEARDDAANKKRERIAAILAANPQIGVLTRKGRAVYYVNFPEYCEAVDPAELAALGA